MAVAGAAVVALATTGGAFALLQDPSSGGAAPIRRVTTAEVARRDLESTTQIAGTLGFAGSTTIVAQGDGAAFTWLPSTGRVIRRGRTIYEVDGRKVPLFYGRRPAWRPLSLGVLPGRDVAQLEANLVHLGYASHEVVKIDRHFTWQTAAAVRRWQTARGVPATGVFTPGDVAYGSDELRVTSVTAHLGAPPQPGEPVLTASTTVRHVSADLPVTVEHLVHRDDPVTVTLPDGRTTARGVVTSVGRVATASQGSNAGQDGGGGAPPGEEPATVTLSVRLRNQHAGGAVDAAPVTVNIATARARNALTVPISALVALAGGGYAVEVPDATRSAPRLIPVRTGLFADTLVQVDGSGLKPGMRVLVPVGS